MTTKTSLACPTAKAKIREAIRHAFFQSEALQRGLCRKGKGLGSVRNREGITRIRVVHYRDDSLPTRGRFQFIECNNKNRPDRDITAMVLSALHSANTRAVAA